MCEGPAPCKAGGSVALKQMPVRAPHVDLRERATPSKPMITNPFPLWTLEVG